ncbi:hypothetical protein ACLOJK_009768 [Asimina triloba]
MAAGLEEDDGASNWCSDGAVPFLQFNYREMLQSTRHGYVFDEISLPMAGESTSSEETSLTETPTWAIAVVFAALVIMSIFLEHALHLLTRVMIFGFLSLLMTIMQQPISKICIPKSYGRQFLPCENQTLPDDTVEEPTCQEQDEISLLSGEAVNELHILMFVLAFFHVFSCVVTLGLGMAKLGGFSFDGVASTMDSADEKMAILGRRDYNSGIPVLKW